MENVYLSTIYEQRSPGEIFTTNDNITLKVMPVISNIGCCDKCYFHKNGTCVMVDKIYQAENSDDNDFWVGSCDGDGYNQGTYFTEVKGDEIISAIVDCERVDNIKIKDTITIIGVNKDDIISQMLDIEEWTKNTSTPKILKIIKIFSLIKP